MEGGEGQGEVDGGKAKVKKAMMGGQHKRAIKQAQYVIIKTTLSEKKTITTFNFLPHRPPHRPLKLTFLIFTRFSFLPYSSSGSGVVVVVVAVFLRLFRFFFFPSAAKPPSTDGAVAVGVMTDAIGNPFSVTPLICPFCGKIEDREGEEEGGGAEEEEGGGGGEEDDKEGEECWADMLEGS